MESSDIFCARSDVVIPSLCGLTIFRHYRASGFLILDGHNDYMRLRFNV